MQYGLQSNNLDMTSPLTANLNDFDATNRQLITGAAGLVPNTTYYYQIQATNTVGTTSSAVLSVTTLPAREPCTHKYVYFRMYMYCTYAYMWFECHPTYVCLVRKCPHPSNVRVYFYLWSILF